MRGRILDTRTLVARMMERSELHISEVAQYEEGHPQLAATRVLESTHTYRLWEDSHSQLMRGIAGERKTERQIQALKRMALSMIHRKAPFEFLRDQRVFGAARHRFFSVMYGQHDFATAVVREHHNYLTSLCSYVCVDNFCAPSTLRWIAEYERIYTSYWQTHAALLLEPATPAARSRAAVMLQCLRADLDRAREQVLRSAPSKADALTLEELRRPTGDTLRLRFATLSRVPARRGMAIQPIQ